MKKRVESGKSGINLLIVFTSVLILIILIGSQNNIQKTVKNNKIGLLYSNKGDLSFLDVIFSLFTIDSNPLDIDDPIDPMDPVCPPDVQIIEGYEGPPYTIPGPPGCPDIIIEGIPPVGDGDDDSGYGYGGWCDEDTIGDECGENYECSGEAWCECGYCVG